MEAIESKQVGNVTIEIVYDQDPQDPREFDNLGTMICLHRRYSLGDQHEYTGEEFSGWDEFERALIRKTEPVVILPLYLHDHGGLSISTESFYGRSPYAAWDSGQVGFILATRADVIENYGCKRVSKKLREQVEKILVAEVEEYDHFLSGDVYGFRILDLDGEVLDSCYEYYDLDSVRDAAESIAKSY